MVRRVTEEKKMKRRSPMAYVTFTAGEFDHRWHVRDGGERYGVGRADHIRSARSIMRAFVSGGDYENWSDDSVIEVIDTRNDVSTKFRLGDFLQKRK